MVDRIECPYCQIRLMGEGFLQKHIRSTHKSELTTVKVKN